MTIVETKIDPTVPELDLDNARWIIDIPGGQVIVDRPGTGNYTWYLGPVGACPEMESWRAVMDYGPCPEFWGKSLVGASPRTIGHLVYDVIHSQ